MAIRQAGIATDELQTLFQWGSLGSWTDSQLITLFVTDEKGSEAAFRVLIQRHGPMVLGVCRRVLGDEHAAEDAFQATFLVLVKKIRGLQDGNLLSNWLYGVALKIASKEKAKGLRRRVEERRAAERGAGSKEYIDQAELRSVIDAEIRRLPERYRVPLVLCHLEGLRHEEVARRLGCPVGTVESRLSRARAQLRTRLERRGLSPTASVIGLLLRPPGIGVLVPSLVETTLFVALEQSSSQTAVAAAIASLGCIVKRVSGNFPMRHASAAISGFVVFASVAVVGFGVFRADTEPLKKPIPPKPTRNPSAVAYPIRGITIDGRLDDWPKNVNVYPIRNQLLTHPSYNTGERDNSQEPDASFMVGYNPEAEEIYLAVVVPDTDLIARPGSVTGTDAVEIYIDGTFSNRTLGEPSEDWTHSLDAATMPVIQYAAVPGRVSAYDDPWDANPSLLYARTKHRAARMKFQHSDRVTTYEWAINAYDRFPDLATSLHSGKRLGLEVAVVDKDNLKLPPYFLTWGESPARFKGFDAGTLGELILAEGP